MRVYHSATCPIRPQLHADENDRHVSTVLSAILLLPGTRQIDFDAAHDSALSSSRTRDGQRVRTEGAIDVSLAQRFERRLEGLVGGAPPQSLRPWVDAVHTAFPCSFADIAAVTGQDQLPLLALDLAEAAREILVEQERALPPPLAQLALLS